MKLLLAYILAPFKVLFMACKATKDLHNKMDKLEKSRKG